MNVKMDMGLVYPCVGGLFALITATFGLILPPVKGVVFTAPYRFIMGSLLFVIRYL
jgi:hypothetical protein